MATCPEGAAGMLEDGAIIIAAGRSRDLNMVGESKSRQVDQDVLDVFGQNFKLRSGEHGSEGDGGLHGTVDDIYHMKNFLKDRKVSLYELLTLTQGVDGNTRDILLKLQAFFETQRLGFVVYFSGHGNQDGDWVLGEQSVLRFRDVYDTFFSRRCSPCDRAMQKLLVIADCCHSGQWVQRLEAKRRQQGYSEDAGRIFIQAACRHNQETKDFEEGGFFTKLYSTPDLRKLHNGAMVDRLSAQEQSHEDVLIKRLENQVPDASIPELTFVVNIGKGIGLTKCWWGLCQGELNARLPTMPLQSSVGEGEDFPEELALDISKEFTKQSEVSELAIRLKVGSGFVDELAPGKMCTSQAFEVLKRFYEQTPSNREAGNMIYDVLWNKLKKRRLAVKFEKQLKGIH